LPGQIYKTDCFWFGIIIEKGQVMMKNNAALFIETVTKYNPLVIYIPGSPDPDAIASAYAIKIILKYHSVEADIFTEKGLSLQQNKAFTKRLKIPLKIGKEINLDKYQAYIVTDFQNNWVEQIGDKIPCVAHIDHHQAAKTPVKAEFSLISKDAGSTSTLVSLIIKALNIDLSEREMTAVSTALTFGIQTDTDKYDNITDLDFEALSYLSPYVDRDILQGINSTPLYPQTVELYDQAIENETVYKDWAFYGLGYIGANYRDSIAVTADWVLKNSDHKVVAVFAVIENHKKQETYLDVSLRTRNSNVDLNRIIKNITPNGGGRKHKGAYQVKLNYLKNTPDKDLLWQVVEAATLETLRKSRDTLYLTGIQGIYSSVRDKLRSIFTKEGP
jgi:nanoRNase/pAp phosphatase (c-di-AMP/oligoRNAs hydrolase)